MACDCSSEVATQSKSTIWIPFQGTFYHSFIYQNLTADVRLRPGDLPMEPPVKQLTWGDQPGLLPGREDVVKCLTGQM